MEKINFTREKLHQIPPEKLYLGDIEAANDILNLKKLGITHVLTCSVEAIPKSIDVSSI
jgi:hypothetical protein